jgi:phosphoglucomutase
MVHALAGKPVPASMLVDLKKLEAEYFKPTVALRPANFAVAGHRGSPYTGGFTEAHLVAVTKAVIDYRDAHGITGPVIATKDPNHLSGLSFMTTVEVLAAYGVPTFVAAGLGYTATPVVSLNIVKMNKGAVAGNVVSAIISSPSHNPPDQGGVKYNPPYGGPIGLVARAWVNNRANEYLRSGNQGIRRIPFERAIKARTTIYKDFDGVYVENLGRVVDMAAIRNSELRMGVDPLGGAALNCYDRIIEHYGIDLTIVNRNIDPRFAFMMLDHDGVIRMDPSSQYATIPLAAIASQFDYAFATDPDVDRNAKAGQQGGVMNPNHSSSVAVEYLLKHRPNWPTELMVGSTCVSSSMLGFVAKANGRKLIEQPVGWQWQGPGLFETDLSSGKALGFAMEESAGEGMKDMDGNPASTDKDGIASGLLGGEIMAVTGRHPEKLYEGLTSIHGAPFYQRVDMRFNSPEELAPFDKLVPADITAKEIAGLPVTAILDKAPGTNAPLEGIKIVLDEGKAWCALRRSGTEFTVLKRYFETTQGPAHMDQLVAEVDSIVRQTLSSK